MSAAARPYRIVPRARAALAACALAALAACNVLPKQTPVRLFAPQPAVAADAAWPQVPWQLLIARPHADATVDSVRMLVRPQPGEVQVYKGAAWTQAAPDLVQDTLLRAFADSGRLPGVARRGEGVNGQYELLLDLRRFESDYTATGSPQATIELGARLVQGRDNRVVAARVFSAKVAADGSDVAAVSRAFERGLGEVATAVVGWTLNAGRGAQD